MHPARINEDRNEISVNFYTACWLFTHYNLIRVEHTPDGKSRYVFPYNDHVESLLQEKQRCGIMEVYINSLVRFKRKIKLEREHLWGTAPQETIITNESLKEEL